MGDKHQFTPRLSAVLWTILLIFLTSLQVTFASPHHHSADAHHRHRHRRLEVSVQNSDSLPADNNKSSKFWLLNSNPHSINHNGWGYRGWHNYLTSTSTTTTTTTTPRPPVPMTPFPSLWKNNNNNNNYPSKRSNWNPQRHNNATRNPLNPKHGRHVCLENRTTTTTTFLQPVSSAGEPCSTSNNQICGDDLRQPRRKPSTQNNSPVYKCCPGWEQISKASRGCNKPICDRSCRNGGKCVKPNVCQCPVGWTGDECQDDINECILSKPCDQTCYNTQGSFLCSCRHGFQIQEDRQSCKSTDSNQVALEASELNSDDIDLDEIDHRLRKLEKAENHHHLATKNHEKLTQRFNQLEQRVHMDQQSNSERLKAFEAHARKTDQLIDLLFKCQRYSHLC